MAAREEKKEVTERGGRNAGCMPASASPLPPSVLSLPLVSLSLLSSAANLMFFNGREAEWVTLVFLLGPHMTRVAICFNEPGTRGMR